MSIFKNILFLQDFPDNAGANDTPATSYAQGYGNHVASVRAFAPLGHTHPAPEPATPALPAPRLAAPPNAARIAEATRPHPGNPLRACG